MSRKHLACLVLALAWLALPSRALAGSPSSLVNSDAYSYAVVVGSNPGGSGQNPLEYAEADAQRVREVLVQLGRYQSRRVRLLVRPRPEQILATLDALRPQLEQHRARGEDATLFFYYSGHARAQGMNLGKQSLKLDALREKLASLPTALTIVVLDACQSGAFSHPKGAEPTADFSFNSVSSLNTRGFAVMASSSSAELSQESERLRSSFFTHYLLVGLRGAGDRNRDGRVSLDEAYRYAYGQTLSATARTAIGEQHVTLETELVGQGDVPMTYPASSTSQVVLPKELEGKLLLQNTPDRAVLAELTKAKGQPVRLAVPPAEYEAVVRQGGRAYECKVSLGAHQTVQLDLATCSPVADRPTQSKGEEQATGPRERWGFETAFGGGFALREDAYVAQLNAFGYEPATYLFGPDGGRFRWSVGVTRVAFGPLSLAARVRMIDQGNFDRGFLSGDDKSFNWETYALSVGPRASLPLVDQKLSLFGQLEVGAGLGVTHYRNGNADPIVEEKERFGGLVATVSGGAVYMPFKYFGFYAEANYTYAPIVHNLIGDTHDSGGAAALFGVRGRTMRWTR